MWRRGRELNPGETGWEASAGENSRQYLQFVLIKICQLIYYAAECAEWQRFTRSSVLTEKRETTGAI